MQVEDTNNNNGNRAPPPCPAREQDQFMPIANVIRIMRRILPPHAKISDDAKETVQECVSEYISFITGEANDRCQREQRKTITAEDLLWAMGKLGFDNYIEPLTLFLNRYREVESDRTALRGEPYVKRTVDFAMPLGVAAPPSFVPHAAAINVGQHGGGMFEGAGMVGYYRDAGGASGGSSSSQAAFNPYAPYK